MTLTAHLPALRVRLERAFDVPDAPRKLLNVRRIVAATLLIKGLIDLPQIQALYGNHGLLPWVINDLQLDAWLPRLGGLAVRLAPLGVTPEALVNVTYGAYLLALLALLLNWAPRLNGPVAMLTHLALVNSSAFNAYGVDLYAKVALFHTALSAFTRADGPSLGAAVVWRAAQAQLAWTYFSAGWHKAQGEQWWTGEAIWRALQTPQLQMLDTTWLAQVPWLATLVAWGTLALELGYVLFIWPRATRPVWLAGTLAMHVGIAALLGLPVFAFVMMTLNVALFGQGIGRRRTSAPAG
ncbi:HTTM domain-containing protein [Deinococcus maricopensis]|uniref:HTTM domain protein n=1 Tax=Deinococcus maricopensis (strain DSM 21211 / LMG 22137 / NRRL B-23946 / LB-34) TaxID=709986 RepID=E8UBB4_DEIML|nr:HTTM domain-containing protein [Deinococcus maricopensis]ADV68353.1 HTTM domain protein [Deinococcus maricopensis DSM 21211]